MRSLGLFFGSDMYGVAIILGTFMGGLALGSLIGGYFSERLNRPLLWYGLVEIGIGAFALSVPAILELFDPLLRSVYPESFHDSSSLYQVTRIALASGTILVPTTLMGTTLPLIMRHFVRSQSGLGEMAAFFYGINTLGALAGTMLAGFLLLPYIGMHKTTLFAAAINFSIGLGCIFIALRSNAPGMAKVQVSNDQTKLHAPHPRTSNISRNKIATAALFGIGISGIGSFALEVVWTRILIMSFSATVYSFTSMLACFLFGIFLGSLLVSKFVDRVRNPLGLLAKLELGVGLSVALLCVLVNSIPDFFSHVLATTMQVLPGENGGALVLATLIASIFLLVIPATLLGATFSVALKAYTVNVMQIGSRTGNLYFANTVGAIIGSLGAVLFLLPTAGAKASLALIALLFALNGVWLWFTEYGKSLKTLIHPGLAIPVIITFWSITTGLFSPYQITLNFNQKIGSDTQLLYHKEGIQSTIDIIRSGSDITSLIIGGNIEADNGYTQKRHFILKGHLPLMFHEAPESVLVVGLGMGITLQATANHEGLKQIHVVELSPEILEAHSQLREVNGDVVANPLVKVRIDDGRSYMKLSQSNYDMITADPIHPKISRVGYLYTREYYQYIRERLNDGGIVCQWMPIYQMSPARLRSAMKTFYEVFPNATFWYVKNHGLFIAKKEPLVIDYTLLADKFSRPMIKKDLKSIDIASPEEMLALLLMGPEEIRAFINDGPIVPTNTDDHPYLEYFVPGDLFYQPIHNVRSLTRHLADPVHFVKNLPPESAIRVQQLIMDRGRKLVDELADNPS